MASIWTHQQLNQIDPSSALTLKLTVFLWLWAALILSWCLYTSSICLQDFKPHTFILACFGIQRRYKIPENMKCPIGMNQKLASKHIWFDQSSKNF